MGSSNMYVQCLTENHPRLTHLKIYKVINQEKIGGLDFFVIVNNIGKLESFFVQRFKQVVSPHSNRNLPSWF